MSRIVAALLALALPVSGDLANQTDWTGGPGTPGPVYAWGSDFNIDSTVEWYACPGSISIEPVFPGYAFNIDCQYVFSLSASDLDGDGDQDILCSDPTKVLWLENVDGSGTVWTQHEVDSYPAFSWITSASPVDVDQDGHEDIIASFNQYGDVVWYENSDGQGGSWSKHVVDASLGAVTVIESADIDGDGLPDIVAVGDGITGPVWYKNWVSGSLWTVIEIETSCNSRAMDLGDIDGDGDIDIMRTDMYRSLFFYENAGTGGVWSRHTVAEDFGDLYCALADVDGDGDLDVFAGDDCTFGWWENTSSYPWTFHCITDTMAMLVNSCCTADIDGDGDPDALTGSETGPCLLYENTGAGDSWTMRRLGDDPGVSSALADLDGSGGLDYLSGVLGQFRWWKHDPVDSGWSMVISSILCLEVEPDWTAMDWTADVPPGTTMWFQVRASDNPSQMGGWSDEIYAPGPLSGLLADNANYLQYRVHFDTDDPWVSPVLDDVTFTWNPVGAGGEEPPQALDLALPCNPSHGEVSVCIGLPQAGTVDICVYDLAGREVGSLSSDEYGAGWHEVRLGPAVPGIYFVVARSGGSEASQRLTVLE